MKKTITALFIAASVLLAPIIASAQQSSKIDVFTQNLKLGSRNPQVTLLQKLLALDVSIYPEGLVTGYFGPLTLKAVKSFQKKYGAEVLLPAGLSEPTGFVGQFTRIKLNQIYQNSTNLFF